MNDPGKSRHGSESGQPSEDQGDPRAPSGGEGDGPGSAGDRKGAGGNGSGNGSGSGSGSGGNKPTVNKKWIFYMAATVIPLTIAVYAGVEIAARRAMDDARQLWEPRLGSAEQLLDRYPHREANASALRLEQLAEALASRCG